MPVDQPEAFEGVGGSADRFVAGASELSDLSGTHGESAVEESKGRGHRCGAAWYVAGDELEDMNVFDPTQHLRRERLWKH